MDALSTSQAYGFTRIDLSSFKDTDKSADGYYFCRGVYYLFKPCKGVSKRLVVNFNGAYSNNITNRVVFRGYNYKFQNADILCICDSQMLAHPSLRLAWYLDTKDYKFSHLYLELIKELRESFGPYSEIILTGSSGGGIPSLRYAALLEETAIIANSQLYPEKYFYYNTFVRELGGDMPEPFSIDTLLARCFPRRIIVYQNKRDSHHFLNHYSPFVRSIKELGMFSRLELHPFSPSAEGRADNHHAVAYPNHQKHSEVLRDYLAKSGEINNIRVDCWVIGSCLFAACRLDNSSCSEHEYAFYFYHEGRCIFKRGYNKNPDALCVLGSDCKNGALKVTAFVIGNNNRNHIFTGSCVVKSHL